MFLALKILAVVLVAVAMSLALAHALELPGKLRLSREQYFVVQPIYYPGFTVAGIAEPLGLLIVLALLIVTPTGSAAFWLTAGGFAAIAAMHAVYWLLTHPVNKFWLKDVKLSEASTGFFAFDPVSRTGDPRKPDWMRLRDRWELSHVVRAGFGLIGLILLVAAVASPSA